MSDFWMFTITVGGWFFLGIGLLVGVILIVARCGIVGKIVGAVICGLILSLLAAMYAWILYTSS